MERVVKVAKGTLYEGVKVAKGTLYEGVKVHEYIQSVSWTSFWIYVEHWGHHQKRNGQCLCTSLSVL
jgi:hypothetical protein